MRNSKEDSSLVADVFITEAMYSRPAPAPDFLKEKVALQELAGRMASDPADVLPRFVELAMQMTGGTSAGLSLYEQAPAPGIFRWQNLCGKLAQFEGATTPRNFSPCGVTLDRKGPVLTRHSERMYDWISDANITVPEVLLVPLYLGEREALGTLWIVSDEAEHFNGEHARIATELATFVGMAINLQHTEERLRQALDNQETLRHEMSHRVKNIFALTDSMIRQSMRSTDTKEQMAEALSGRLHALSEAYSIVLQKGPIAGNTFDLPELMKAVLKPHDHSEQGRSQFTFSGNSVRCGEAAVSGIAIVLNELATNAVKYGALSTEAGRVAVNWTVETDALILEWQESSAKPITPPSRAGFGSRLISSTVERQFKGSLEHNWAPTGLSVAIRIPRAALQLT